jgi:excisionase family DNA binding protein
MHDTIDLLTVGLAARLLNTSADNVRRMARVGQINYLRLATGERLFRQADVEQLRADRKARAQ